MLARGPGRNILYRFGRYIGLTSARLDAATVKIKKGGILGLSVATDSASAGIAIRCNSSAPTTCRDIPGVGGASPEEGRASSRHGGSGIA